MNYDNNDSDALKPATRDDVRAEHVTECMFVLYQCHLDTYMT